MNSFWAKALVLFCLSLTLHASDDQARLMAAMMGKTQLVENLASLTDEIGGRPTGSEANLKSIDWALARFAERGVSAHKEAFTLPNLWVERKVQAQIEGDFSFSTSAVAMPYGKGTDASGAHAPLVDVGFGDEASFKKLGGSLKGVMALVHTQELNNLDDLFREYTEIGKIQVQAQKAGVAGLVFMGSRPKNLLYRHNAGMGTPYPLPVLIIEREVAQRIARLLAEGRHLNLHYTIEQEEQQNFTSYNVIGEIKGSAVPEEFVVIGAHLDSFDLGTGALDNGCNVALILEVAAQMQALQIQPKRTIRFALWNGEEPGMYGSYGYTLTHAAELDRHKMTLSMDIGSGKLQGFFIDGASGFAEAVASMLQPVAALGPFQNIVAPLVGTDNFDFMLQGVPNLIGNQATANYGPNYHARSDTFDKVDLAQLRLNSVIVAAVTLGFAECSAPWPRRTRAEIEALMKTTDLPAQMETWGYLEQWNQGKRGLPLETSKGH